MSLSVPLEPSSKEILHISAHYLVILLKYMFNLIQKNCLTVSGLTAETERTRKNRTKELPENESNAKP